MWTAMQAIMRPRAIQTRSCATDERISRPRSSRYTPYASSAVYDGMRKHSPCPLMTTTGAQRKPGVQVRLVAESPKASKCSHLNPRFKVVFAGIAMAEDVFFCGLAALTANCVVHVGA